MAQYPLGFISNISAQEICFTETCIQTASSLLSSLDMNVDPCSDFYKYACNNWIKQAVIPEDLTEFGILDAAAYQHKEKLRSLLDGVYSDLLSSTLSPESYQVSTEENIKIDQRNFKLLQNYFASCVDIQAYEHDALSLFLTDIKTLKDESEWQMKQDLFQLTYSMMNLSSQPQYTTDSLIMDVAGLFSIEFYSVNTNQKMLILTPPKDFKEHKVELAFSIFGLQNLTERDRHRIRAMKEIGLEPMSNSDIYSMFDGIISLQERLIELADLDEDYDTYTTSKAKEELSFIDWTGMFASANIETFDIPVQVYNVKYFKELNRYAAVNDPTRPIHKEAIANFVLFNKILTDAPVLDSELRQIMPDSIFQTRSSLCVERVLDHFGLAAGRFYSMIAFGGESDRTRLEDMAINIKHALMERIQNANWLDYSTKTSAIEKLHMMKTSIGYSTSSPDQRSPQDISEFMFGLKTNFRTFYENEKAVGRWRIQTYWDTLSKRLNSTSWIGVTTPQVVNAFNLLSKNSIFVSAGFAQKPNYDSHYPDYLNYAGIGQSIGHEYSHGFDDLGSQYDENGLERNWWSKKTKAVYEKKTQCFIDTYSKAAVTDKKGENHFIDGTLTLGESIADHEGLTAAYYAFLDSKKSKRAYNPILPGLHNYSTDALFFINAARSFCSKSSAEAEKDSLSDEHAPDSIRLNVLLQNSMEFSKVFNCPVGSRMNPSEIKCHIW